MLEILDNLWESILGPRLAANRQLQADCDAIGRQITEGVSTQYANLNQKAFFSRNSLESRFKELFESKDFAISFYDKDGYLIELNDEMKRICHFDSFGEEFFRSTRFYDAPYFKDQIDPTSHEHFHACQHMLYPELGIDNYIEVRVIPVFDDRDELAYYVVSTRDITEQRKRLFEQQRLEQELKEVGARVSQYETELAFLLRNSNMYVWKLDLAEKRVRFTRTLKNYEFEETLDEYVNSIFEEERAKAANSLKRVLNLKETFNTIHHFMHTPVSNAPQWLAITGMPTLDQQGNVTGLFGILRNIDDLMGIQEQLRMEQKRARESGIMKSAFLANMTHEIRTPLNAIVGFSDLLQVVDEQEERQEFIRIIRNNCDMLLRLINDILETSDVGQELVIEPADIDFAVVFDDICQTLAQRVQEPGVEFLKENPFTTYPTHLDKGRVQQVITNFVTNAVKYTHQGHIKVGYFEVPRDGQNGLYIYCEDTGAGIPKDKQPTVFDRFVKLNDNVQGTGLGLSICKNIVERCGGEIGVTGEGVGKGSTFWFWIPCEKMDDKQRDMK